MTAGGLMTDRAHLAREGTLSPTAHPDNNRRITSSNRKGDEAEWNDLEEPYIRKWIDYSNKYGVGYVLTSDAYGAYFNDNTKLILSSDT
jgi:hypothetical protein